MINRISFSNKQCRLKKKAIFLLIVYTCWLDAYSSIKLASWMSCLQAKFNQRRPSINFIRRAAMRACVPLLIVSRSTSSKKGWVFFGNEFFGDIIISYQWTAVRVVYGSLSHWHPFIKGCALAYV